MRKEEESGKTPRCFFLEHPDGAVGRVGFRKVDQELSFRHELQIPS